MEENGMEENVKEESKTTAKSKLSREVLAAMFMQALLSNPNIDTGLSNMIIRESFEKADEFIAKASE